jgi:acetyl/propionyl-CoA carboxylase alpha subunit
VEFLLDTDQNFYFIEVNPRIQVEHPVTEMVTGIDLVNAQILLAASGCLTLQQDQIRMRGTAIEARIIAEDPDQSFMPTSGQISYLQIPSGSGIRVDSALYQGMWISTDYDSLIAKLIVWGEDRATAIRRMISALDDFNIAGLTTDLGYLKDIVRSEEYLSGQVDTMYLESFQSIEPVDAEKLLREAALAAALYIHKMVKQKEAQVNADVNQWRTAAWREQMVGFY